MLALLLVIKQEVSLKDFRIFVGLKTAGDPFIVE